MKKAKKNAKKLVLDRETVKQLTDDQVSNVAGGYTEFACDGRNSTYAPCHAE